MTAQIGIWHWNGRTCNPCLLTISYLEEAGKDSSSMPFHTCVPACVSNVPIIMSFVWAAKLDVSRSAPPYSGLLELAHLFGTVWKVISGSYLALQMRS